MRKMNKEKIFYYDVDYPNRYMYNIEVSIYNRILKFKLKLQEIEYDYDEKAREYIPMYFSNKKEFFSSLEELNNYIKYHTEIHDMDREDLKKELYSFFKNYKDKKTEIKKFSEEIANKKGQTKLEVD